MTSDKLRQSVKTSLEDLPGSLTPKYLTCDKELQPLKAREPIEVTEEGIVTDVKE